MEFIEQILLINDIYPDKSDKDMPMATLLNATKAYGDHKIDFKEWQEWYISWAKQMKERLQGGEDNS